VREIKVIAVLIFSILCLIFFSSCGGGGEEGGEGGGYLLPGTPSVGPDELVVGNESKLNEKWYADNTGSGIYYNTELWGFYPHLADGQIIYRRSSNGKWGEEKFLGDEHSKYAVSPVIFKGYLYLFWVGTDAKGSLNYIIYTGNDKWESKHTFQAYPEGEVAPVYNPQLDRLEVYFRIGQNIVCRYTYDGINWAGGKNIPNLYTDSAPSAEVIEMIKDGKKEYRVMLAHRSTINDKIHIDILDAFSNVESGYFLGENITTKNPPHLVNLGNGQIALLYRGLDDKVYLWHYDEDSETWVDFHAYDKKTVFHVRGAAYYIPHKYKKDGKDVIDLEGYLMVFWAEQGSNVKAYLAEYLGEWKNVQTKVTDWAGIKDKNTQEPRWDLFPVVGIIDAPPFVFNGGSVGDNGTTVTYSEATETGEKKEWSVKAGVYVETKEKCPIDGELHIGLTKEESETINVSIATTYSASTKYFYPEEKPYNVKVFYMAPMTHITRYLFYKNDGTPTEREIDVVNITGASLLSRAVPRTQLKVNNDYFPQHTAGDLRTYEEVPDTLIYSGTYKTCGYSWEYTDTPTGCGITQILTKEKAKGGYVTLKIGVNIMQIVGAGFEGEFNIKFTQTTTFTSSLQTIFANPEANKAGDIIWFGVTVYWLDPNKDGYWVPENRKGLGDAPWFITFNVPNYAKYPGAYQAVLVEQDNKPAVENGGPEYFVIDGIERPI
jgi:hypothetical protein